MNNRKNDETNNKKNKKNNMKCNDALQYALAVIACLCVVLMLLISSFEWAMYSDNSFYQTEYEKYKVTDDLGMDMKDIMYVTDEMMEYLRGNREELSVQTTVFGTEMDFFNNKDRSHMKDVQELFLGGLRLRMVAIVLLVLIIITLAVLKCDWKKILPRGVLAGIGVLLVLCVIIGIWSLIDFTSIFTVFHKIAFDNNNWLLDPRYDNMIRMLPEGLFSDMVVRISKMFIPGLLIILGASISLTYKRNKTH